METFNNQQESSNISQINYTPTLRTRTVLSLEQRKKIFNLLKENIKTIREIAFEVGCSESAVSYYRRLNKTKKSRKNNIESYRSIVNSMRQSGKTIPEISSLVGISKSSVNRLLPVKTSAAVPTPVKINFLTKIKLERNRKAAELVAFDNFIKALEAIDNLV